MAQWLATCRGTEWRGSGFRGQPAVLFFRRPNLFCAPFVLVYINSSKILSQSVTVTSAQWLRGPHDESLWKVLAGFEPWLGTASFLPYPNSITHVVWPTTITLTACSMRGS